MYTISLIGGIRIVITEAELPAVQAAISNRDPLIIIGKRSFAYHQFSNILPKEEADFMEKMELRVKGFYRCKKGVVHKLGDGRCDCNDTGNMDPRLPSGNALLAN